jgi:hypothetical protein
MTQEGRCKTTFSRENQDKICLYKIIHEIQITHIAQKSSTTPLRYYEQDQMQVKSNPKHSHKLCLSTTTALQTSLQQSEKCPHSTSRQIPGWYTPEITSECYERLLNSHQEQHHAIERNSSSSSTSSASRSTLSLSLKGLFNLINFPLRSKKKSQEINEDIYFKMTK